MRTAAMALLLAAGWAFGVAVLVRGEEARAAGACQHCMTDTECEDAWGPPPEETDA